MAGRRRGRLGWSEPIHRLVEMFHVMGFGNDSRLENVSSDGKENAKANFGHATAMIAAWIPAFSGDHDASIPGAVAGRSRSAAESAPATFIT